MAINQAIHHDKIERNHSACVVTARQQQIEEPPCSVSTKPSRAYPLSFHSPLLVVSYFVVVFIVPRGENRIECRTRTKKSKQVRVPDRVWNELKKKKKKNQSKNKPPSR